MLSDRSLDYKERDALLASLTPNKARLRRTDRLGRPPLTIVLQDYNGMGLDSLLAARADPNQGMDGVPAATDYALNGMPEWEFPSEEYNLGRVKYGTPMQVAARDGNIQAAEKLAAAGALLNEVVGIPPHWMNLEIAKTENGERGPRMRSCQETGITGFTLPCLAGFCGHVEMTKWLIERGAPICGVYDHTPLHTILLSENPFGFYELLPLLERYEFESAHSSYTTLNIAIHCRSQEIATFLLQRSAPKFRELCEAGPRGGMRMISPYYTAAEAGEAFFVDALAEHGFRIQENPGTSQPFISPLFWATSRSVVQALARAGFQVNIRHERGRLPLHEAQNAQVLEALIDLGTDPNDRVSYDLQREKNPYHPFDVVDPILVVKARLIETLISRGVELDEIKPDGQTVLHKAAYYFWTERCQALVKAGANIATKNAAGQTPYDIAAAREIRFPGQLAEQEACLKTLKKLGA